MSLLKLAVAAIVVALAINTDAIAQEVQFTMTGGFNGTETFDLNLSDGNSESDSINRFETEDDLYFGISNDNLGNDVIAFGGVSFLIGGQF
jgi:hypothetical protein